MIHAVALDHVVLRVEDIDRSLAFYRDVLGLGVESEEAFRAGRRSFLSVRAGSALIDLVPAETLPAPAARGIDHLCLEVLALDWEQARAWLRGRGVTVESGPARRDGARGWGTSVYIRDPDGYQLELKVYPDAASQERA